MKNKISFRISYFLVTRGFTFSLLWFILTFIDALDGDSGSRISTNEITIQLKDAVPSHKLYRIIEEYGPLEHFEEPRYNEAGDSIGYHLGMRQRRDTINVFNRLIFDDKPMPAYLQDPYIDLPVEYFKKSHIIHYFILQARILLKILIWLLLLYQIYLILDDIRKDFFFIPGNTRRIRKAGYCFLILSLLDLFAFKYKAILTKMGSMYIMDDWHIKLFDSDCMFYLTIGLLIIVLSWIFKSGFELLEENKLTI